MLRCSSSFRYTVATVGFVPFAVAPTRSARVIADEYHLAIEVFMR